MPGLDAPVKRTVSCKQSVLLKIKLATGPGFTIIFNEAFSVWLQQTTLLKGQYDKAVGKAGTRKYPDT